MRSSDWSRLDSRYLREPNSPYGPGPHVPAGLGRKEKLVAVGREILSEQLPEIRLGAAVGRPVVVREIEVADAEIERAPQDRALRLQRPVTAEVVPQPQRDQRQLDPAAPTAPVGHALVAVVGGDIGVGADCGHEVPFTVGAAGSSVPVMLAQAARRPS